MDKRRKLSFSSSSSENSGEESPQEIEDKLQIPKRLISSSENLPTSEGGSSTIDNIKEKSVINQTNKDFKGIFNLFSYLPKFYYY